MTVRSSDDPVAVIEVVCLGNICRSPYASALLRAAAAERLDAMDQLRIRSCGIRGLEGHPAAEGTVLEAARRGLDLTNHVGERWTTDRIREADLVITMTEGQRTTITEQVGGSTARTFTIRELARLVEGLAAPPQQPGVRERIVALVSAAQAARPMVARPRQPEDVEDPYGGPPEGYARMAAELDRLVLSLADHLFGGLPNVDDQLFGAREQ
ncbi:MAG: hypothetical protein R3249_08300 [Nitriliruptorales bacterium]|nr:hypothetical protein [Nitriliruptorales bacterium]